MDKRQIIAQLSNICDELDNHRNYEESAIITNIMRKIAVKDTHDDPTGEGSSDPEYKPKQNIIPGKSAMKSALIKIHSLSLLNEKGHNYYSSHVGEDAKLGNFQHVTRSTMRKTLNKLKSWNMLNEKGLQQCEDSNR